MSNTHYYKIPTSPQNYSGGNIISKILDGLGYRFYWVTEGLRSKDVEFRIVESTRTTLELLLHICDLTEGVRKVANQEVLCPPFNFSELTYSELREHILQNIEEASRQFKAISDIEIEGVKLLLEQGGENFDYPLWNVLVGPITDIGYHLGQVALNRRASGNPVNPNINPFLGYTI